MFFTNQTIKKEGGKDGETEKREAKFCLRLFHDDSLNIKSNQFPEKVICSY